MKFKLKDLIVLGSLILVNWVVAFFIGYMISFDYGVFMATFTSALEVLFMIIFWNIAKWTLTTPDSIERPNLKTMARRPMILNKPFDSPEISSYLCTKKK